MKNIVFPALLLLFVSLQSCNKGEDPNSETPSTPAKSYDKLKFTFDNQFFSTESGTVPLDSVAAQQVASTIDFTFIYNTDYMSKGIMDPVTRSKDYYWDDYRRPWLSAAKETRLYDTKLTKSDFDAAKNDQSKIGAHFKDSTMVILAPHGIFPSGTCIGGRISSSPQSLSFRKDHVYGFKILSTGKMGFVYVHKDQPSDFSATTYMDLIKEK
ncbi:MAG: hypothetical protein ACXWEY_10765 [Bacteroidia bacterium]